MLPPEIQRVVLLIGMAATAYLLILAWNDDMEAAKVPTVYSDAPLMAQEEPFTAPAPIEVDEFAPSGADIPAAIPADSVVSSTPIELTNRLVKVETPALLVWIDLKGGDIVRVQLPTYPVTLEEPDTPFLLMDQSAARTYIAQSALIGPDGIDRSGERPLYSAPNASVVLNDGGDVTLRTTVDGAKVTKTFVFEADSHLIDVRYDVTNVDQQPKTMRMLSQIKRDRLPPSTDETVPLAPSPYLGGAVTTEENNYEKIDFDDIVV